MRRKKTNATVGITLWIFKIKLKFESLIYNKYEKINSIKKKTTNSKISMESDWTVRMWYKSDCELKRTFRKLACGKKPEAISTKFIFITLKFLSKGHFLAFKAYTNDHDENKTGKVWNKSDIIFMKESSS